MNRTTFGSEPDVVPFRTWNEPETKGIESKHDVFSKVEDAMRDTFADMAPSRRVERLQEEAACEVLPLARNRRRRKASGRMEARRERHGGRRAADEQSRERIR